MSKVIIYPSENGGVHVVIPTPEYMESNTIDELAKKDVPSGKIYEIVDASSIPSDRTFREAWVWE